MILFFPFLALVLLFPNGYNVIFWYARNVWASFILFGMGFYIKKNLIPELDKKKSYLLVANHASYIDPFVMLRLFKTPFVFVGKKELDKIPFFGFLYRRAAILVDRAKKESRFAVYGQASSKLDKGYSVCIFPEKDYLDETILLNPFKHGAFKIAVFHHFPVVPMLFLDCKRKQPWYTTHGYPGKLRVNVYPPVSTKGMTEKDVPKLLDKIYNFMESELRDDPERASLKAINIWKRINKIS